MGNEPLPKADDPRIEQAQALANELGDRTVEAVRAVIAEKLGDHPIWFEMVLGLVISRLVEVQVKIDPHSSVELVELLLGTIAETLREITPNG